MKKFSSVRSLAVLFLSLLLISGAISSCKEKDKDVIKPKTITDLVAENNDFTILREIIRATGMSDALRSQELTLFAPNDAAFRSSNIANASTITSLPKDSALSFVKQHLLGKRVEYKDIQKGDLKMLSGKTIVVSNTGSRDSILVLGRAYVILKNINADNGIIHVLDRTLTVK
jgi:uncharacterized surface protein with fasciclin (FAS1) repeats